MSDLNQAIQKAENLARTPEGQQLARLLQQLGGNDLQMILERAAAGDLSQARQTLSVLMQDPQARQLLEKLGGNYGI